MLYIYRGTNIAWTWYGLIGSLATLLIAWAASFAFAPPTRKQQDELAPGGALRELS
jgi:hypothetical protein